MLYFKESQPSIKGKKMIYMCLIDVKKVIVN